LALFGRFYLLDVERFGQFFLIPRKKFIVNGLQELVRFGREVLKAAS
jgi:hypothetical protein